MTDELTNKKNNVLILSEKHFDLFSIAIRNDGIARIFIKENVDIDVVQVKQIVHALEEEGQGKKYPLLIVVGEYTLPTAEARAYTATAESDPFASAEAYVINSFSQRLVGNVYLSLNKPFRPTRLFNDEVKAVEWLKTFL
jgi:hypothetical protein